MHIEEEMKITWWWWMVLFSLELRIVLCFLLDVPFSLLERLWTILPLCTYQDPGLTTPGQITVEKVEVWRHCLYYTLQLMFLNVLFFTSSSFIFKAAVRDFCAASNTKWHHKTVSKQVSQILQWTVLTFPGIVSHYCWVIIYIILVNGRS